MLAFALSLMLLAAQPAPGAPATADAPPAKPATEPPPPTSARLETQLAGLKGKPKTALTARLGPPLTERKATDGEVLFWTVRVAGETVCGGSASGALVCGRQGDGECVVAAAFDTAGGLKVWRTTGLAGACDKAADMLAAPPVTVPKYKSED